MEIKSWYQEYRENMEPGEELEQQREEARQAEEAWVIDGRPWQSEEGLMHEYANLLMEKELRTLGSYLLEKYAKEEDQWYVGDVVFWQYGRFCMFANRPEEAAKWFKKALKHKGAWPYLFWKDLVAAYIESGEYAKADYWIRRYVNSQRKENILSRFDLEEFADFYIKIGKFERALAYLEEGDPKGERHLMYKLPLAKAYIGVGRVDEGLKIYEEFVEKYPKEGVPLSELALYYYNEKNDIERAEAAYLKCLTIYAGTKWEREWNRDIHNCLSIIYVNEGLWDKCFEQLKLYYLNKYEGEAAEILCGLIDSRPRIDDDGICAGVYQAILAFEESPVLPINRKEQPEGSLPENPAKEVDFAKSQEFDLKGSFGLDEASLN